MKKNSLKMIMMTTMMLMFVGCMASTTSVQAATKKTWKTEYMKIVKKMNKEDQAREKNAYSNNEYTYDLIYFNNDKTPELVVGLDGYWVSMYTFDAKKKKAYAVMDQWGYGACGNVGYEYIPKKNTLRNYNSDFAGAIRYVYFGKMKNHKIVSYYKNSLKMVFFTDKNNNGYPDEDEYDESESYYYGDKKVSSKKFDSYMKEGKYKPIIGKMSYKKIKNKLK
ncbi:MAG: hypothetical protein Q4D51_00155 [Eubacteriales bacterium]|nr:hypothetical protein [Eubacteriales bacterium]